MSKRTKLSPELQEALKQLEAEAWQPSVGRALLDRLWLLTKRHNSHLSAKHQKEKQLYEEMVKGDQF
jgi:hypothetical protein